MENNGAIYGQRSLSDIHKEIQQLYQQQSFPWVIGYSGGKDSTTALQLIWYAIAELPAEQRQKKIYVISTNTLVETPVIVDHVLGTIKRINDQALRDKMPFVAQILYPETEDTFWVNLIGKGYPAPNSIFRWCTDRLKIKPSNKFIISKVAEHGEVILALGIRKGESNTRDQVISMHRVPGMFLARHGQLNGAWVYMPIEQFTIDDIWTYLIQTPSPWGNDNLQLASLYQSAQDGECPLVVDQVTPSCGNSRFGCWTCTVVSRDKSMEAMIDNGAEWMIPLLNFRDWLGETQNPDVKPGQREFKGRDGRIIISKEGKLRYRTYTLEFSKQTLERLLLTQKEIQQYEPEFNLISEAELRVIRRIWITERQDWEDSLPVICERILGTRIKWEYNDVSIPGMTESSILNRVAQEHELPEALLKKLIDAEWQYHGMQRRSNIHKAISKILNEDWRDLKEVQEEIEKLQYPNSPTLHAKNDSQTS